MKSDNDKISEVEAWVTCFAAILNNENTKNIDTAAALADQAFAKIWERFETPKA